MNTTKNNLKTNDPSRSGEFSVMQLAVTRIYLRVLAVIGLCFLCSNAVLASSTAATVGQSISFSLTVDGTAPFSYQWYKNGNAVAGATDASYAIPSVTLSDAATYTAIISNSAGSTTSDGAVLTVSSLIIAPAITLQPTAQSVTAGQSASFSVTATGSAPLAYQWQKNGINVLGATSSTFAIASTASSDASSYSVSVSNSAGSVTSTAVALSVTPALIAPSIVGQPSAQSVTAGSAASFSVNASGSPTLTYQWQKNGVGISGATASTFSITSTASADAANYSVTVTNSAGAVTSTAVSLTVVPLLIAPSIIAQPTGQSVTAGGSASFSVSATGSATLTYQWQKNGVTISGATLPTYTIASAASTDAANYSVSVSNSAGSVTSATATLAVSPILVAPSITTQPTSKSVSAGLAASFSVTATGSATLTYQWRKNGIGISGANAAGYTIANTASTDAGNYSVTVSNSAGSITSTTASLSVNPVLIGPSITLQPTAQSVSVGQAASFAVTATGSPTLTYQWQKNGSNIAGATTTSYSFGSAAATNAGNYAVVVSNSVGSVTSTVVSLTVNAVLVGPSITTQPTAQAITVGQSTAFSVVATGSATLAYQWRKNGVGISGATSPTYSISSASNSDAANYSVIVSNSVGSVTSTVVSLTVSAALVAPSITAQPVSLAVTTGKSASFSVTATGSATLTYQWEKAGTVIAGAIASTYTITSAASADAANYSVIVSNPAGSIASKTAALTVSSAPIAPSITSQPTAQSVTVGQFASFTVAVTGSAPLTYQWKKNGVNLSGANLPSFTLASTALSDAASYSVSIGNSAGSVTSTPAALSVNAALVAPSITSQPAGLAVTVGDAAAFTVIATGSAPLSYQWQKNGSAITGATSDSYSLANTTSADAANYSVVVTNPAGSLSSIVVNLTVNDAPPAPTPEVKLINLSTRSYVGTGEDVLIAGFIIGGDAPKTVLLRASGPALAKSGITGFVVDPTLELHDSTQIIATNDNWGDDAAKKALIGQACQITGATVWDDGSNDAAILITLAPGAYTAIVAGKNNGSGVALVEAYEVDLANDASRLINISSRSLVKIDANVQIAGFVISGSTSKKVIIRASGPALIPFGITDALADPVLEIHDATHVIASNDNWDPVLRADFIKQGIDNWAIGSKDAAMVITLPPGAYTAIVSGKNGTSGVALVEVFEED